MSNPVGDKLSTWTFDADGADSNPPTGGTALGVGQSGDLSGELRRIKSETKGLAENLSWSRWVGERNLANTGTIAFTFIDANNFRANDDLTASGRNVAVVGRRVKAIVTAGTIFGAVTAAVFPSPNTTVTVSWDSGALDSGLSEVMFGPELRAVGLQGDVTGNAGAAVVGKLNGVALSGSPVNGQFWLYNGSIFVPDYEAGINRVLTNRTGGALAAGDVVTMDTANDSSVVLADTASSQKQFLVSLDAPANTATGRFQGYGVGVVNVTGAVTRGHYLVKSGTTKVAADSGVAQGDTQAPPAGSFGVALTAAAGPGAGNVAALLFGYTVSIPAVVAKSVWWGSADHTVSSGTTYYPLFAGSGNGNESLVQMTVPFNVTAKNLYVHTVGTQPSTGSLVVTLRVNGVDSALTVTVPANQTATTLSDTSHTVTLSVNDTISLKMQNNASTTSTSMSQIYFEVDAS